MGKFKYFLLKNKIIIIITSIVLICAIAIAIGVYAQVTNRKVIGSKENQNGNDNHEELETTFDEIFTNEIKKESTAKQNINYEDMLYCAYNINEEKANYSIDAKIPLFKLENDVTKEINKKIYDTFANTIANIVQNATVHTTFNLDYVAYANNNILSLVIRCKYKDGSNPQRDIIMTYNYDVEQNKVINIDEAIQYKGLNKEDVQKRVLDKIKEKNVQMRTISNQGYNVYMRNEEEDIYKIENTPNFFIGQDNYLYLVYAYGNKNFTSEIDLVIF